MTTRYGGQNGAFAATLEQFKLDALEAIEQALQDVVIQIGQSLISLSPVDTGRFKGNWQLTQGGPADHSLITTDPEGTEALAKLIAGAGALTLGESVYIVNTLIYAIPLEYGHSQKAPSGMVRVTLDRFQQIVDDVVRARQV
ncbi:MULTISPECIES: HK97 gp10 family phage protein [unclassified Pseudomonas]|uniref:HK97 gp10 family phage protein n=1 Tax=unclassified Pseudomonas TaxID=196821 RepID=UPI002114D722|nr:MULTISPECIES: HK97 gp10 family phage protein [unclassified Pseudomonas]